MIYNVKHIDQVYFNFGYCNQRASIYGFYFIKVFCSQVALRLAVFCSLHPAVYIMCKVYQASLICTCFVVVVVVYFLIS